MSNKPKTAYDLRRVKVLVDMLAIEDNDTRRNGIEALIIAWDIDETLYCSSEQLIHTPAKHAQRHAHEQIAGAPAPEE